jgi:hypothetical protein
MGIVQYWSFSDSTSSTIITLIANRERCPLQESLQLLSETKLEAKIINNKIINPYVSYC